MSIPVQFKRDTVGNARACNLGIVEELRVIAEGGLKGFIFTISLLGTTIQGGGMRERSDVDMMSH